MSKTLETMCRTLAVLHGTTAYYEKLVFEISVMLTAFPEEDIYEKLINSHFQDTLEYAINDAKNWRERNERV